MYSKKQKQNPLGLASIAVIGVVAVAGAAGAYAMMSRKTSKPRPPTPENVADHLMGMISRTVLSSIRRDCSGPLCGSFAEAWKSVVPKFQAKLINDLQRLESPDPEAFKRVAACVLRTKSVKAIDKCLNTSPEWTQIIVSVITEASEQVYSMVEGKRA